MSEKDQTPFHRLPARIKHYLLDWKESHIGKFIQKYGVEAMLTSMSEEQLKEVFAIASEVDKGDLFKVTNDEQGIPD